MFFSLSYIFICFSVQMYFTSFSLQNYFFFLYWQRFRRVILSLLSLKTENLNFLFVSSVCPCSQQYGYVQ